MNTKKIKAALIFVLLLLFVISWYRINFTLRSKEYKTDKEELTLVLKNSDLIKELLHDYSGPVSDISFIDGVPYFTYEEKPIVKLEELTSEQGRKKIFENNSFTLSYYSLSFLRNYLLDNDFGELDLDLIDSIISIIINDSNNYFWYSNYIFADQAVSERMETLFLYNSLKTENQIKPDDKQLKHLQVLINLLQEDSFFTYSMNHGLMQIKSLLRTGILLNNPDLIEKAVNRIKDIKGIFYGDDGAPMESATGYQVAIMLFFYEFHNLLTKVGHEELLKKDLENMAEYFASITTDNYYIQGMGDSESFRIPDDYKFKVLYESIREKRGVNFFKFSNRISGISSDKKGFSLLFASMDNKPSVHKLPEDLSVYIYNEFPLFMNTGRYSYEEQDKTRRNFLTPSYQNGPKFTDGNLITKSDLSEVKIISDTLILLSGYGINNNDSIHRTVRVLPEKSLIQIKDTGTKSIYSNYIINPDLKVKAVNERTVIIYNDSINIRVSNTEPILIETSPVSFRYKEMTETNKLVIKENNELTIEFDNSFQIPIDSPHFKFYESDTKRMELSRDLKDKYDRSLIMIKIKRSYLIFGIFTFIISLFVLLNRNFKLNMLMFLFLAGFLIVNIYDNGALAINVIYNHLLPLLR